METWMLFENLYGRGLCADVLFQARFIRDSSAHLKSAAEKSVSRDLFFWRCSASRCDCVTLLLRVEDDLEVLWTDAYRSA